MKKISIALLTILNASLIQACVTCYGALADHSPPFFAEEAYTPFTSPDAKAVGNKRATPDAQRNNDKSNSKHTEESSRRKQTSEEQQHEEQKDHNAGDSVREL